MGRRMVVGDLVGTKDIAVLVGCTDRRVRQLADADDLPKPVGALSGNRRVWRRRDVERWLAKRARC